MGVLLYNLSVGLRFSRERRAARDALGSESFFTAFAEGQAITQEQALEYALQENVL